MADDPQPEVLVIQSQRKIPPVIKKLFIILLAVSPVFIIIYALIRPPILPKQPPTTQPSVLPSVKPKIQLPCPSSAVFCSGAKPVIKDKAFWGLGAKLEANTPIYAVFDGEIILRTRSVAAKPNNETFLQIELVNKDKNLKAFYFIKGNPDIKHQYKQGEEITKVPKELITTYDNNNLIFLLTDNRDQIISVGDIDFTSQAK
ncbi:hypothetical protein A3C26_02165 [Candidatus Daviesbacteria bacterium RIFCSPHIGHO2_02_FULL_39_12]|uniref:Peptidase M23 domain-containing protein n=1 Tax=Candidatus Daviesbacteria bacterium RIFCSPHIGHO2_02_FULL_39_12 TaxID=1797770 RepID=A0A1F5J956_9BACT|nr:MAG: hypothetical protein A3C26_02165 [Candidatus Daviesbacteria bacterium RIFCSPHIGHO2_02_FULL_39_12]